MKFTISLSEFKKAVQVVCSGVVSSSIDICQGIKLEADAEKQSLTLWSTDMFQFIFYTTSCRVESSGEGLVPSSILNRILTHVLPLIKSKDTETCVELQNNDIKLYFNTPDIEPVEIKGLNIVSFPGRPEQIPVYEKISLPIGQLSSMLAKTGFAIDIKCEGKNGYYFMLNNPKLYIIGLDGKRTAITVHTYDTTIKPLEILVPKKVMDCMKSTMKDLAAQEITIAFHLNGEKNDQGYVEFHLGNYIFHAGLLNKIPFDWETFPGSFNAIVEIDSKELMNTITFVEQGCPNQIFTFEKQGDKISLKAPMHNMFQKGQSGIKKISRHIPHVLRTCNTDFSLNFNSAHIKQMLQQSSSEKVTINFPDNQSQAALIDPQNENEYQYIIIPAYNMSEDAEEDDNAVRTLSVVEQIPLDNVSVIPPLPGSANSQGQTMPPQIAQVNLDNIQAMPEPMQKPNVKQPNYAQNIMEDEILKQVDLNLE